MVWCASMARMTRFAICTGCSRARNSRAVQPSITRLAIASSRSSIARLQDLRPDEDDGRRHVDPGQQSGGERKRAVRLEDTECAGEEPEPDLGDLPEHGRYQRRPPRGGRPHSSPRGEPEHEVEEPEAECQADERRDELDQESHATETRGREGLG